MKVALVGAFLIALAGSGSASAMPTDYQPQDGTYFKLSTQFRGTAMSLDVVNGGAHNNEIHLAPDGNFTGQFWHIVQVPGTDYYTLTTKFRGDGMCLDINLPSMRPHLNPCGNYTGQHWYIRHSSAGMQYRRLSNNTQGSDMCLDINPDDNAAEMRPCGNYTGQAWMFGDTGESTPTP
ncbi:MAG: RICIN domain-containing protein [Alphaproteobacteria bacterium]|nr:RICIN domain-containing protein [Alphaproteobacteria bacterium]MBL7097787.1 RICIN domain-containing protein [Alphaproteobacteria bacterium]